MRTGIARVAPSYVLGICVFLSSAFIAAYAGEAYGEAQPAPPYDSSPAADGLATSVAAEIVWTRQFGSASGGVVGQDEVRHIALDASGIYVAGNIAGALPGQTFAGGYTDAFVRKYDASGNELWTRQFGSPGQDLISDVVLDASGLYLAGGAIGALPGQTYAGGYGWDAFVRKYDVGGNEVWTRQFGTPETDAITNVALDSSGLYVAGITFSVLPGQMHAGGEDAFARKYDVEGNELWTRQFGTSDTDDVRSVALDASGIYVAGLTYGDLPGQTNAGQWDVFVRKYDRSGNEVWTQQFGTSETDLIGNADNLAMDASGIYVAGYTYGEFPRHASSGLADAFVTKYDSRGRELWTQQFGSSENDFTFSIALDASGVYVAGYTLGTLPGQTSAGASDVFVRKYDSRGRELWTRQFGSSDDDGVSGFPVYSSSPLVAVDPSGVYVSGLTLGTFPGQTSAGGFDVFVRNYDSSGSEVWTRQFGTPEGDDIESVALDASGVYVAGSTYGTFPGQMSAGGLDAFVAKLAQPAPNRLPTLGAIESVPAVALPGQEIRLTASASDPDGDALTYTWDFGDGASATGTTVAGGGTITAIHAYMAVGTYTVALTADDGKGGVVSASASVVVLEPGLLRVTTNPPAPGKIIVDGVPLDEWGTTWVKFPPGTYTLTFTDVYALGTPAPQTINVYSGKTTEAVGNYAVWANLRVTTSPAVPSTIYVNDVPSNDWGMWRAVPAGTYTVRWGPVVGWDPPAPQTFTLAPGEPKHVEGLFTQNSAAPGPDPSTYGLLRVTTNPALPATIYANGNALDEWGTTWVKVPPGTYTISFKTVYGFTVPPPTTVVVNANGAMTEYEGKFVQHGNLKVETNPPVPATIFVDGIPRNDWGMWQSMEPGTYRVYFGPVAGYVAPGPQTAVVVAGELTSAVGTYVLAPPAVAGAFVDFQGTPQAGLKIPEAITMGQGSIFELIAIPRGLGTPAPAARDTASTSLEQRGGVKV